MIVTISLYQNTKPRNPSRLRCEELPCLHIYIYIYYVFYIIKLIQSKHDDIMTVKELHCLTCEVGYV